MTTTQHLLAQANLATFGRAEIFDLLGSHLSSSLDISQHEVQLKQRSLPCITIQLYGLSLKLWLPLQIIFGIATEEECKALAQATATHAMA
eukprot:1159561-Pelagomonas_calceolata.AAC.1